jgi:hypothetical protein
MQKQIIFFTFLFAFNLLSAQNKENTITGKWIGTDETNQTRGIEFSADGKARLLMFGEELPQCDYKANYQTDPIEISLIVKRNGKEIVAYGLIKFIDTNTIKWEMFPMVKKQPKTFSEGSTGMSIELKRSN